MPMLESDEPCRTLAELERGLSEPAEPPSSDLPPPAWLDLGRFRRGQAFFRQYALGLLLSWYMALITGLSIPRFLHVLVATERSDTEGKARYRYLDTFRHLLTWHLGDVWCQESAARRSLAAVQMMHFKARRSTTGGEDQSDERKPWAISQYDLGVVQSGFVGPTVLYPDQLGIGASREELGDYVYFWRCIGYLLGIKDKYNICGIDFDQTRKFCLAIQHSLLVPSLTAPGKWYQPMLSACLAGNDAHVPVLTEEMVLNLATGPLGVPPAPISLFGWIKLQCVKLAFKLFYFFPALHCAISANFINHCCKKYTIEQEVFI